MKLGVVMSCWECRAEESAQVTAFRSRATTPSFVSHSRNSSTSSAQVQATIDQLRSHAGDCP